MSSGQSAASRSGQSGGSRASSRRGRLDERVWRDVTRACKVGKRTDAYSVEVHGVRVVFKMGALNLAMDTKGRVANDAPARRQCDEPMSAPQQRSRAAPNSAQRRSAKRLQEFIKSKKGSGSTGGPGPASSVEPPRKEPARVEADVRRGADAMETDGERRRGEKRTASETPALAQPTAPLQHQHAEQRAHSQVEPTGRRGRGLEPLSSEEVRRMNSQRQLSDRRERQRPTN